MSRKDELKNVILKTEELIKAPNCYAGLREKAETWLAAIDTPKELEAAVNFVKELKKSGAKYCDCVACKPSLEILANEKLLLKR